MATIQAKTSRGYKYWYIVESKRVNGKPRPVVLAYLGKAEDLLKRLQGLTEVLKLKSYSHGAVCALLAISHKLDLHLIINQYINSSRKYTAQKPVRNNLTAGITFLLGAIGRVCMPTSKRGWWNWAKTTSLEYLLQCSLNKIDSQHFWDLMDSFPVAAIEKAEMELLQKVLEVYPLTSDTLFFDTTNFFTYIDSTNTFCDIAQRGKNKQKRYDLRQVGLALVVTRENFIPLFHHTYQGNMNDTRVFRKVVRKIKQRILELGLDINQHTLVFDRGNNSKENLGIVKALKLHYVGALTPYDHKGLINEAVDEFKALRLDGKALQVYRDKRVIWGEERSVIVFISERLKAGQLRGIYQSLEKKEAELKKLQETLCNPRAKKREKVQLEDQVRNLVKGQFIKDVIDWSLTEISDGKFQLTFSINNDKLKEVEDALGFRIVMTDHHSWSTQAIIKTYYGQSTIEHAFKNLKNPYHLTLKPQFHWTDQKIMVHYFICVLGYLLATLLWREAKLNAKFKGSLDTLLDTLNNIRLVTILDDTNPKGRVKAVYKLEEMSKEENSLMEALKLKDFHINKLQFNGVSVYRS
jgi:transposase